ncbi:TIGR01841 family phasin [Duganella sp. FT109W]|uniref:TIGR01841 family phasin n=1 Tax=Duganella margarita TaxID=2692170 RepID=A0ABW9WHH0_9BURK|nr:phasin family protein [Duganella margarita]MYN39842.1 TIGR01841 family phasin [Duganella margarita]
MSSITEQFSAATKSQLEAQFQIFNTLASAAVESAEKVIALNLNATKASVEKSSAAAKQWLAVKDPKELFTLSAQQQGSFDSLLAYGRELASIASAAQAELIKSAQSSFKQASELAAAKPTVLAQSVPTVPTASSPQSIPEAAPALAAAVSAAVIAANEPIAAPPKPPKAKPAAAPIPEQQEFIEVKAQVKPSFPAPPPKPIALAPETKPAKSAPKAKK